ncbi:M3 family metallopeptidase, partial [Pontiella sp.]|uniref:M3 family metallopeptidase n=1 Tax=Pontiella sp. TaxID=2837462 RepID=UPI0035620B0A
MSDLSDNPLMNITTELRFAEFDPSHVVPAITALIERAEEQTAALEQNIEPGWDALMGTLEEIWSPVWAAWGMVCHLNAVKNSDELRAAYEEVQPRVVEASLKSGQSRPIYDAMVALRESDEFESLDAARQRVLEKEIKAAELGGVGLDGAEKKRFNEIANTQSKLKTTFTNHVLDATKAFEMVIVDPADTEGWPSTFRSMASQSYNGKYPEQAGNAEKGPWRVTLDGPSAGPFLRHSRNRAQREKLYLALITRASEGELDNRGLIVELLKLRAEQAALLGFKNYAELSLATKMAPDVAAVRAMAGELEAASRPCAEKDKAEVEAYAAAHGAP